MPAPPEIVDLVRRFDQYHAKYTSPSYNEFQVRKEFIDPFFEALGWDVNNRSGLDERYKDVIHEDTVRVETSTRAPDYSFRIGGVRKFFVEAKKPAVNYPPLTQGACGWGPLRGTELQFNMCEG